MKNIWYYGKNCTEVAGQWILTNLSNSTREAIQDRVACVMHNTQRIEIHTTNSDQPAVRSERNVSGKAFLGFYSSMHQRNEYRDSKDQAKRFCQHREWYAVLEVLFLCVYFFLGYLLFRMYFHCTFSFM
jgi:hypothetical protein